MWHDKILKEIKKNSNFSPMMEEAPLLYKHIVSFKESINSNKENINPINFNINNPKTNIYVANVQNVGEAFDEEIK